jgi:ABC-2 type transport system permease protein
MFCACGALAAGALAATLVFPFILEFLGEPDWGIVAGAYLGNLFLAGALAAIGVFASSLTHNQVIAYLAGWAVCFAFFMFGKTTVFFPYPLNAVIEFIGFDSHVENVARGILDTRDLAYFTSLIGFFLAMPIAQIERRHRREAA